MLRQGLGYWCLVGCLHVSARLSGRCCYVRAINGLQSGRFLFEESLWCDLCTAQRCDRLYIGVLVGDAYFWGRRRPVLAGGEACPACTTSFGSFAATTIIGTIPLVSAVAAPGVLVWKVGCFECFFVGCRLMAGDLGSRLESPVNVVSGGYSLS